MAKRIKVKGVNKMPYLYPLQRAAFFHDARYGLIEASTKAGKTVGGLSWITKLGLGGKKGQNYWWVAPVSSQSKIAFTRIKKFVAIKNQKTFKAFESNETEHRITLYNGAFIWFKSGDHPDSLYGEDVYGAVIDEASRVKEDSWTAVRSTLTATRGPVRIVGNVRGKANWHYKLSVLAKQIMEHDPSHMQYHRLTAKDAVRGGVLDAAEIVDARRVLPFSVWMELYMAVATDDGSNPFGIKEINACKISKPSTLPVVVWGLDLGRKVDYVSLIGLDKNGHVANHHRWQLPWKECVQKIISIVGTKTNCYFDATGIGDVIGAVLMEPSAFFDGEFPKLKKLRNFIPYIFTSASKQVLMEGLRMAFSIGALGIPPGNILTELLVFEYTYTRTGARYEAPPGMHDDEVCALALAKFGLTQPPYDPGITF